ncbi:P1 family peptidase [Tatumella ptyseos]|uniref:L-aminopeptidase/D-esterase n=2 Tax=Tatumella ptyseos TaxID=82987 RepID=A0A2X5NFK3_9GAMM|nr:P1 family peptidase [Tatumella ptyseos]KFD22719.1 putative peptidase [Tatumella ptyseos ATCC 33301]SQK71877.1 L-aminopeptidase/D-esterase [Tatumella ptyseos]
MVADIHQQQQRLLLRHWRETRSLMYPRFPCGRHNLLSDVPGVRVGHSTLADGERQTGVTAILPPGDNLFLQPLPCGVAVLNGFAKPAGLIQIEELGELQTPILLSNTFAVGTLFTSLVSETISRNPQLGRELPTVNPLVLECNDGWLNDIQALAVTGDMACEALSSASANFSRGSVGAGRGMSCFSLKGGIGSASREIPAFNATLGVLVLANYGTLEALTLQGVRMGELISPLLPGLIPQQDAGSIIIIMATDAPVDARQLKRIARRAGAGLGRTGSYWGHGSGDIAVAFSTQRLSLSVDDAQLEPLLAAAADATEHAVLDALLSAQAVTGFRGHHRAALTDVLDLLASADSV